MVYVESTAGDWVGQGRTYRYTLADAAIGVTADVNVLSLNIRGDEGWDAQYAEDANRTTLSTGDWTGGRYPFTVPGLAWFGEGRELQRRRDAVHRRRGHLRGQQPQDPDPALRAAVCVGVAPPMRGYIGTTATTRPSPPGPATRPTFPWTPPAGAVPATGDYFYFESSPGDYIGQGRTSLYAPSNATISATESIGVIDLHVDEGLGPWDVNVSGPDAQTAAAGRPVEDLGRYPFHNPTEWPVDVRRGSRLPRSPGVRRRRIAYDHAGAGVVLDASSSAAMSRGRRSTARSAGPVRELTARRRPPV